MENMSDKSKGVICYLFSIIGGLIFLIGDKSASKNVKIHAAQAIIIGGGYVILNIVVNILYAITGLPFISSLPYICYAVCLILGIVKVVKEQDPEIPVIGQWAKSIFAKQIGE